MGGGRSTPTSLLAFGLRLWANKRRGLLCYKWYPGEHQNKPSSDLLSQRQSWKSAAAVPQSWRWRVEGGGQGDSWQQLGCISGRIPSDFLKLPLLTVMLARTGKNDRPKSLKVTDQNRSKPQGNNYTWTTIVFSAQALTLYYNAFSAPSANSTLNSGMVLTWLTVQ